MSIEKGTIDAVDLEILRLLQADARVSNAEIARRVEMAPSAVFERLRKLESRGIVRGYEPRLDPAALGVGLAAFVLVRADERVGCGAVGERLAAVPHVQEVHHIAGEDCYLVKVRVENTEALGRLLRDGFGAIPEVRSTRTTIVLTTIKETGCLALGLPAEHPAGHLTEAGDD